MALKSNQIIYVNCYAAGRQILRHVHCIHNGGANFHALTFNYIFLHSNEVGVSSASVS
jgi:hypothetical protein